MSERLLSEWQSHLSMESGAAATLLGLVFVSASINLRQIVATPALPGRVVEAVVQFTQVLFISMMMTIPHQSSTVLAVEILVVAFGSWALQLVTFARYHRARLGHPAWWLAARIVQTHISIGAFIVAGVYLLLGRTDAIYWVIPGFFFSFFAGLVSAWVLLIRVGGQRHAALRSD